MLVIPIQPVPSQRVLAVLGGQNCQIAIYIKSAQGFTNVYVDLNSNGTDMCLVCLAHNGVPLDACNSYDGFQGNLYFVDTQGNADPQYTGFNTRWFLVYLTPEEVGLTAFTPEAILNSIPVLTLSTALEVTAPSGGGNFEVAHGLDTVPFLIEIVPTAAGAIWGQAGFADATNIYLVGSGTGVTATVLVFTMAAVGLTVQTPAATLLVESPSQPPDTFNWPHGIAAVPSFVEILPTSDGDIWEAAPADGTNLYLAASAPGQTATISVYAPIVGALNIEGPATILTYTSSEGGPFELAHGLPAAPSRIEILRLSSGVIRARTPAFDATNVYLQASDLGVIAKILVYA